jgi:hypothetical protein
MNDPSLVLMRLMTLLFVPSMLLFPLFWALLTPNRAVLESERLAIRSRMLILGLLTLLALGVWIGLLLIRVNSKLPETNLWSQLHLFAWTLFFPLWFGVAMPIVRSKTQLTNHAPHGENRTTPSIQPETRTASLVNREREISIRPWEWFLGVSLSVACVVWIGLRGCFAFSQADDGSSIGAGYWGIALTAYAIGIAIQWLVVRWSLKLLLAEPEPMDSAGSEELLAQYREYRRIRAIGLFWLTGIILPVFFGVMVGVMVWWPSQSRLLGWVGGIGGSLLGLLGACLGMMMTAKRMRIEEYRKSLDASLPSGDLTPLRPSL